MPIPEAQLARWANQGATDAAKRTHESIRNALARYANWPSGLEYDVYLQGSYRNSTNIRGDSDVDIIAELNTTFRPNTYFLSDSDRNRFEEDHTDASVGWQDFHDHALTALSDRYGSSHIFADDKCIRVSGSTFGHLDADVVPALQYRLYTDYTGPGNPQDYAEGIAFWVRSEGHFRVNYPKLHYHNGVQKNGANQTDGRFKRTVRIFKNMRHKLIDDHAFARELAPSYFIECLVYNIPASHFVDDDSDTVFNVLNDICSTDVTEYHLQNGLFKLFGADYDQWPESDFARFRSALLQLWNDW